MPKPACRTAQLTLDFCVFRQEEATRLAQLAALAEAAVEARQRAHERWEADAQYWERRRQERIDDEARKREEAAAAGARAYRYWMKVGSGRR